MQNKEEEKRIREDFKNQFKNKILRISNHTPEAFDLIDDLQSFISQEIEKSYQRGREEGRGENLSTTESITETLEIPKTIINTLRLQTLEKMERVIKEKASLKTDDKVVDIAILLFSEDILQQLNKMKTNEKTN